MSYGNYEESVFDTIMFYKRKDLKLVLPRDPRIRGLQINNYFYFDCFLKFLKCMQTEISEI